MHEQANAATRKATTMSAKKGLTIEEKLKIAAMSRAGTRQRRIAAKLNIDVRQIRKFQRSENLPIIQNGLAVGLVQKIVDLTSRGLPQNQIARRLRLNPITVAKYQRRAKGVAA
jgi:DNA-binding CsgD family transcriptional regulator